jgi:hypothetical protein
METSTVLDQLRHKLCAIHPAELEPASYLLRVFTPGLLTRFLQNAHIITPQKIEFHIGIPFGCHVNALQYCLDRVKEEPHYTGTPYLTFRLFSDRGLPWCLHSVAVEDQGKVVVDSGGYLPTGAPAVYFGTAWTPEILEQLKRSRKPHFV